MCVSQEPARNANAALVQDWNSVKALKASMAAQRKSFALSQPVTKEKRKPRSSRADVRFPLPSPASLIS